MKSLIIVRHAKSSWDDHSLADIDRPLNERGARDAPRMAERLKDRNVRPSRMISSPAVRAMTTCLEFAQTLNYPIDQIMSVKAVYHAGAHTLLEVIQQLDDHSNGPVMLFGHNPGLTDFVNDLMDEEIDNIPTTGIVACKLKIDHWSELGPGRGVLEYFDYPKKT